MLLSSVLLDARTAGAQLPRHLAMLQRASKQWYGSHELLVVDDTGDARLPALTRRHEAMLIHCSGVSLGSRLNVAVAVSRGDVLLFPGLGPRRAVDWLSHRLRTADEAGAWDAAVLRTPRQGRLRHWWHRLQRTSPQDTFWVARDWFERIGGLDPKLDAEALPELLHRLRACQARVTIESA